MGPIRVLIVDDSVLLREVLSEALQSDPAIEIAGVATSGQQALELIPRLRPTLVTLDQGLAGLSASLTLAEIRKLNPRLPVILFSAFSERGFAAPYERDSGLTDYFTKPDQRGSRQSVKERLREALIPRIRSMCTASAATFSWQSPFVPSFLPTAPIEVVAIGASTGGPEALARLIADFPEDFPVPILIVQHMPPPFTRLLAERLDPLTTLCVQEAIPGARLAPGQVWIAPGDYHMTAVREGSQVRLATNRRPCEQGCRPSVDVLFRSLAETYSSGVLAVVLTGMGSDGTSGAQAIRQAGGEVIVQDEATSAIWGMPGRVVAAGLAQRICPLEKTTAEIVRRVYASREPKLAAAAGLGSYRQ